MVKKILITGCRGFIGSSLKSHLERNKHKIDCLISRKIYDKSITEKKIKDCDVIVHLAAITNPYNKKIWEVNVDYTKFVVGIAKKFNKKFIYLSTQNVLFGKDNYSKTKRFAESIVRKLNDYVILRPTIVYDNYNDKYIGRLIKLIKGSLIVPIIGNGNNKIQPIYLEDLIKIISICANKRINGTYLIAGKSKITYNELVDLIIKRLNLFRIKIHVPILFIRPIAYLTNNSIITTVQLDNLKINQVYETKEIEKIFNIKLKAVEETLK